MTKAVIILSGGMDSTTLLYSILAGFHGDIDSLRAISFNYGQRHRKELRCAKASCEEEGIPHEIVNLSSLAKLLPGSALTDLTVDVPEGHYEAESMQQTVVPNRNAIMLSIAAGYASACGATELFYGAHSGDHHIYKDCRPDFVVRMRSAILAGTDPGVNLQAPFLYSTKGEIAAVGKDLGVDYSKTWTCYKGGELACGKCGACVERLEAMAFAGITDPLEYSV